MRHGAKHTAALVLTIGLFALWGFGHQFYETLLPQVARVLGLQGYELVASQGMSSIVYLLGAIPAAICARRFGYKATILLGLGSFCVGAFVLYPATENHSYTYFMTAVCVMGCGWILLEIAANPLIADFGNIETAVARLNAAQSLYPIGGLVGLFLGRWILDADLTMPAPRLTHSMVHPYIVIGLFVLVLAFLIDGARFPAVATDQVKRLNGAWRDMRALLAAPMVRFAMVAQFCSVLALAATWSLNSAYMAAALPTVAPAVYADVFVWSLAVFGIGRVTGSLLMYRIDATKVLAVFAAGGIVLSAIASINGGLVGAVAMVGSSFFLSITWPSVLGIAIAGRGMLMKLGTAVICMGGALGGFAYQVLAAAIHAPAVHLAMVIPMACYVVILAFAITSARRARRAESAASIRVAPPV